VIEKQGILENNNKKEKGGDGKEASPGKTEKEVSSPFHIRQGEKTNL